VLFFLTWPLPSFLSFCSLTARLADPARHLEFLTDLLSRITQDKSPDAHVLVLSTLAHAKLLFGDLEGSKTDIDAAWKILDNLDAVDNSVNGAYYHVAADYYKVRFVGVESFRTGSSIRFCFCLGRQRPNMHRTTGTRYFTSLASTWKGTCHRRSACYVHTIWHSQRSWQRRSTTLASWYVFPADLGVAQNYAYLLRRFGVVDSVA
jgi:hypothetical protein